MYARIQTTDHVPDLRDLAAGLSRLVDTVAGHPGFAGLYALRPVAATGRTLVTLWDTEDDARQSADRTREELGPRPVEPSTDLLYEVRDDFAGVATDATPTFASMIWHAGQMSEETAAIGRRARRERIAPAVLAVPGVVRMISLFQPDTQQPCTLGLLTSAEVGEAVRATVESLELAPEERWVRDPERREFYTVAATAAGPVEASSVTTGH